MSGALHRQMRMLGTEFDRESIVTSQRRRRRPERWSGYVCVCFYVFVLRVENLVLRRNENDATNRQVKNYYIGDYVLVKWSDNQWYRGNVESVQKKRNRTVTIEVVCTYTRFRIQ